VKSAIAPEGCEKVAGEALPPPGWDASLILCRRRDLYSRH
jgi:hypothetical protein